MGLEVCFPQKHFLGLHVFSDEECAPQEAFSGKLRKKQKEKQRAGRKRRDTVLVRSGTVGVRRLHVSPELGCLSSFNN